MASDDSGMRARKPKLAVEEQIAHLKSKGVTFDLCSEGGGGRVLERQDVLLQAGRLPGPIRQARRRRARRRVRGARLRAPARPRCHRPHAALHATADDSFRKIVVVNRVMQPCMDDDGILTMGLFDFLLDENSFD